MFSFFRKRPVRPMFPTASRPLITDPSPVKMEDLEGRALFSFGPGISHEVFAGSAPSYARSLHVITFDQAPDAVQTGLTSLASSKGVTAPTAETKVALQNIEGAELYTIVSKDAGTVTRLTVDDEGNAVTAPTRSEITWADLTGSGDDANAAAAAEINKIVAALELEAPADTDTVRVLTKTDGTKVYTVVLSSAEEGASTAFKHRHGLMIAVDSSGNPVGNTKLPFSVLPTVIRDGLNANAPTGATPFASDSDESVKIKTVDGVTLYTATFTSDGSETEVTVNKAGALTSGVENSTTTFGELSSIVQTAIQDLVTDAGGDILDATTSVAVSTRADGEALYTVSVEVTKTNTNGEEYTVTMKITVDADGNPTIVPGPGFGRGGPGGHGGHHGGAMGGGRGGNSVGGSASGTSSGTTSTLGRRGGRTY